MIYLTPTGVPVYVLKQYRIRYCLPENWGKANEVNALDFIQGFASGLKKDAHVDYQLHKDKIPGWLKEEIPPSVNPRFVVSPPSQRAVAGDLARSLSKIYDCIDLSESFAKKDRLLRAAEQSASLETLVENLICSADLGCIKESDSILIVDDVFSTGNSIDCMKEKIIRLSRAHSLSIVGAAILKV